MLHVTDSLIGGVGTAVAQYVAALPEVSHAVVASTRGAAGTQVRGADRVLIRTRFDGALMREGATLYRSWSPDIVHLHSSRAGLLRAVSARRQPIVFSPHGFAFIRQSVGHAALSVHTNLEALLARRGHVVSAVSEWEAEVARRVGHQRVFVVPHAVQPDADARVDSRGTRPLTVGVLARIDPAKAPDFVAQVARATAGSWAWAWAGDGDEVDVAALAAAGIDLRGWVDGTAKAEFFNTIDVLAVLSQWEATVPYSALEAVAAGVPVVGRTNPAFSGADWLPCASSVPEIVALLASLADPTRRRGLWESQRAALATSSVKKQAEALSEVYADATRSR